MFYLVRTLKEHEENRINTDFVLEAENDIIVKEFFNKNKFIILGISQVQWWPKSAEYFWILQIDENSTSPFCLKSDSAEEAVKRCVDLSLPIIRINTIKNTISEEESKKIINDLQQKKSQRIHEKKQAEDIKKQKDLKMMDDKKKEKILKVITDTLAEIKILEETQKDNTNLLAERKALNNLKEQLTKIRMWSNLEKATSILEETFSLMEKIEILTINELKQKEEIIDQSSIISNIDIISELDKIKRAQQVNEAGTRKTTSDLYYTYLWIVGLYQKFIAKDAINKISHIQTITPHISSYIGFGIISSAIFIWLLFIYYILQDNIHYNILLSMISVGIAGFIWSIISLFKSKSFFINLVYIILAIILTIIIQKGMIIFFALV